MNLEGVNLTDFYTEEEICQFLRISKSTLNGRLSRGTNHPPYKLIERGLRVYPKKMFNIWIEGKPIIHEVRSA